MQCLHLVNWKAKMVFKLIQWKPRVIMLRTLSSMMAPAVVMTTTWRQMMWMIWVSIGWVMACPPKRHHIFIMFARTSFGQAVLSQIGFQTRVWDGFYVSFYHCNGRILHWINSHAFIPPAFSITCLAWIWYQRFAFRYGKLNGLPFSYFIIYFFYNWYNFSSPSVSLRPFAFFNYNRKDLSECNK